MVHGCQWGPGDKPSELKKKLFRNMHFCAFLKDYHKFLSSKRVSALSHCFNLHSPMGMGYTFAPPRGSVCTPFRGVFKKNIPLAALANPLTFFTPPKFQILEISQDKCVVTVEKGRFVGWYKHSSKFWASNTNIFNILLRGLRLNFDYSSLWNKHRRLFKIVIMPELIYFSYHIIG